MRTSHIAAVIATALLLSVNAYALDFHGITVPEIRENNCVLIENGVPVSITYDKADYEGVMNTAMPAFRNANKEKTN